MPTCNYACSYCNVLFPTTWQNDIRKDGAYQNLVRDGARAFNKMVNGQCPYGKRNEGNSMLMSLNGGNQIYNIHYKN